MALGRGVRTMADCSCDQCVRAVRLVEFAEELGFELQPYQRAVMLNLAKCSREAVAPNWLEAQHRRSKRRLSELPPGRRPVVRSANG